MTDVIQKCQLLFSFTVYYTRLWPFLLSLLVIDYEIEYLDHIFRWQRRQQIAFRLISEAAKSGDYIATVIRDPGTWACTLVYLSVVMPSSPYEATTTDLTPLRAHYLKKSLIQLQFARELDFITSQGPTNVSTLSYLGFPFSPPPKDAQPVDLPFLRYIFRQFVLTFPFMAAAPKDFYSQKLQPFVAAMVSQNLSSTSVFDEPDTKQASRKTLVAKFERSLSLFLGGATKLLEREELVRLTQSDLDRLDVLSKKRQAHLAKTRDVFEVNIVSVRTVLDKGRIRNRLHDVCNHGFPIWMICNQNLRSYRNLSSVLGVHATLTFLSLDAMEISRPWPQRLILTLLPFFEIHNIV